MNIFSRNMSRSGKWSFFSEMCTGQVSGGQHGGGRLSDQGRIVMNKKKALYTHHLPRPGTNHNQSLNQHPYIPRYSLSVYLNIYLDKLVPKSDKPWIVA